ncbi:hypothetical protein [Paenibacillus medicaginis]|uniref:Uncharacterized protein n=1 Tax=Paenibacillus medicaginis TaxID=1470560 RepID=A0ABV5C0G8_9BACL
MYRARNRPDLHTSTEEEHKRYYIGRTSEYLAKNGADSLEEFLDYLYDQAYLKGQVDERMNRERIWESLHGLSSAKEESNINE